MGADRWYEGRWLRERLGGYLLDLKKRIEAANTDEECAALLREMRAEFRKIVGSEDWPKGE